MPDLADLLLALVFLWIAFPLVWILSAAGRRRAEKSIEADLARRRGQRESL